MRISPEDFRKRSNESVESLRTLGKSPETASLAEAAKAFADLSTNLDHVGAESVARLATDISGKLAARNSISTSAWMRLSRWCSRLQNFGERKVQGETNIGSEIDALEFEIENFDTLAGPDTASKRDSNPHRVTSAPPTQANHSKNPSGGPTTGRRTAPPSANGASDPDIERISFNPSQRVLIIDDSEMTRSAMSIALAEVGYLTAVAANVEEFEKKLKTFKPEIVITDINMPDIQGDEVCKALKGKMDWAEVPVLICSSMKGEELQSRAEGAGADGYVSKTEGMGALVTKVQTLI